MSAVSSSFPGASESARQYFSRLSLFGQTRSVLAGWSGMSAQVYFAALGLPQSGVNTERRPCSSGTVTLLELFQGVSWK
jgi:hypothetical protein